MGMKKKMAIALDKDIYLLVKDKGKYDEYGRDIIIASIYKENIETMAKALNETIKTSDIHYFCMKIRLLEEI